MIWTGDASEAQLANVADVVSNFYGLDHPATNHARVAAGLALPSTVAMGEIPQATQTPPSC
jgi:hypothetical protein